MYHQFGFRNQKYLYLLLENSAKGAKIVPHRIDIQRIDMKSIPGIIIFDNIIFDYTRTFIFKVFVSIGYVVWNLKSS